MKERLAASRMIVHALERVPRCVNLAFTAEGWNGEPSPLWRKRLVRHVRDCALCLTGTERMIPAERLLAGLPLLAVPAGLAGRTLSLVAGGPFAPAAAAGHSAQATGSNGLSGLRAARHARILAKGSAVSMPPKLVAVSVAVVTCAAGGTFAVTHAHHPPRPAAVSIPASASALAAPPLPLATHSAHLTPSPKPSKPAQAAQPAPRPRRASARASAPGTSPARSRPWPSRARPGTTTGAATPNGVTAPAGVSYVPMIWGAANVTSATLSQVSQEGRILLGFNEPDLASQSNMTVAQALDLWPKLMATGMTLGSPAVAAGAATPGGWLDQFMAGAKTRGYRVDFITVHWYGGDFSTGPAVQELESYLQAIYAALSPADLGHGVRAHQLQRRDGDLPDRGAAGRLPHRGHEDARRPVLRAALRVVRPADLVRQRHDRPVQPRPVRHPSRPGLRIGTVIPPYPPDLSLYGPGFTGPWGGNSGAWIRYG